MRRALISVSDKTGLVDFARGLVSRGFELVSTGGIAARRGRPYALASATTHGITLIDLVVVNLYPFVKAASNPDTPFEGLIEEIDIGGPSLVRAAAKNFQDVLVVVSPADYGAVLAQLDRSGGPSREFRFDLARKAFAHTGGYDTAIASTLATITADADGFRRETSRGGRVLSDPVDPSAPAPTTLTLTFRKLRDLRYGENPHQNAAWY